MLFGDLPRSYLVKQKRNQLNDMCHVTSTPGIDEGEQVSSKELLREWIKDYVTTLPTVISQSETLQAKISGDGSRMTRSSNFNEFCPIEFALLNFALCVFPNHQMTLWQLKEIVQLQW